MFEADMKQEGAEEGDASCSAARSPRLHFGSASSPHWSAGDPARIGRLRASVPLWFQSGI